VTVVFSALIAWSAAMAGTEKCYLREEGGLLLLGNERIEMVLNPSSGFVSDLWNKQTDIHNKVADSGAWPFGVELGYPDEAKEEHEPVWIDTGGGRRRATPEEIAKMARLLPLRAEIRADHVQKMRYESWEGKNGRLLTMVYNDLKDDQTWNYTGIRLTVEVGILSGADFFLMQCKLENHGVQPVTSFYAGRGGVLTTGSGPEEETLTAYRSYMQARKNHFGEKVFGYKSWGAPVVPVDWLDFSGSRGGVGIEYINRAGYAMLFKPSEHEQGMSLGWHMFRSETSLFWLAAKLNRRGPHQIHPLQPGKTFTSGEWIVALWKLGFDVSERTVSRYRARFGCR